VASIKFPEMVRDPCFKGQTLNCISSIKSNFHGEIRYLSIVIVLIKKKQSSIHCCQLRNSVTAPPLYPLFDNICIK